jgi:hypothetical protein
MLNLVTEYWLEGWHGSKQREINNSLYKVFFENGIWEHFLPPSPVNSLSARSVVPFFPCKAGYKLKS